MPATLEPRDCLQRASLRSQGTKFGDCLNNLVETIQLVCCLASWLNPIHALAVFYKLFCGAVEASSLITKVSCLGSPFFSRFVTYSELRPHSCFQQVLTSVVGPMAAKCSLAQKVARLHFVHQSLWLVWSFSLQAFSLARGTRIAGGPLFPAVQTAETSSQPAGRVAVRLCGSTTWP